MAVIGIDLGTTYSAAARTVNGVSTVFPLDGEPTLPSVVSIMGSGKIVVGRKAKNNQALNPQNTVVEAKRKMGTTDKIMLGVNEYSAQEISAMILSYIKELVEEQLGEPVTGVVISCPAYFMAPAHEATMEAGKLAGLKVLKIVNEPTAAAYAYSVRGGNDDGEKLYVVYDLGGGTFDVTVIRMVGASRDVVGSGGDPKLGGGDFDDRIVDWILEHIENDERYAGYRKVLTTERRAAVRLRLKSFAEKAKINLCSSTADQPSYRVDIPQVDLFEGKPVVFQETLTLTQFHGMIADLLQGSLHWIDEALKVPREKHKYAESDITAILLVGGSSRVPAVREMLAKRFPNTEIRGQECGINPDEIVALGASMIAADEDPDSTEESGTLLLDVTGHTLSVAVRDDQRQCQILQPIIVKDTKIPCRESHDFQGQGQGQTQCKVEVYQGEGIEIDPTKVAKIGDFCIKIDPIQEPTPLRISLALDDNGILLATAINRLNGQSVDCKLNYQDSAKISPQELEERRKKLEAQLQSVVGQAANPLDGAPSGQQGNPWASGKPDPSSPSSQTSLPPRDPLLSMNGILLGLYQKAIRDFMKVPPEKQAELTRLVTDIETAAQAGNQQALQNYTPQLARLLEGVA